MKSYTREQLRSVVRSAIASARGKEDGVWLLNFKHGNKFSQDVPIEVLLSGTNFNDFINSIWLFACGEPLFDGTSNFEDNKVEIEDVSGVLFGDISQMMSGDIVRFGGVYSGSMSERSTGSQSSYLFLLMVMFRYNILLRSSMMSSGSPLRKRRRMSGGQREDRPGNFASSLDDTPHEGLVRARPSLDKTGGIRNDDVHNSSNQRWEPVGFRDALQ